MKNKKQTKKVVKPKITKKVLKKISSAIETDLSAVSFQQEARAFFALVLRALKSALYDAFRQYVEYKLKSSQTASVEDFMDKNRDQIALHGITKDDLVNSLNPAELDFLIQSQASKVVTFTPKETIKEVVDNVVGIPDPHAPTVKAEKVSEGTYDLKPVAEKKPANVSVFDSLDII